MTERELRERVLAEVCEAMRGDDALSLTAENVAVVSRVAVKACARILAMLAGAPGGEMTTLKVGECDGHEWHYGGLRYTVADYTTPGGSARPVTYYDWFYCSRCRAQSLDNPRIVGTSYDKLASGALPA